MNTNSSHCTSDAFADKGYRGGRVEEIELERKHLIFIHCVEILFNAVAKEIADFGAIVFDYRGLGRTYAAVKINLV